MSAPRPDPGPPTGREPAPEPVAAPAAGPRPRLEARPQPRPLTRRWSRALVGGTALAVAAVVIVHLAATFLYNAPANPVSQRYASSVKWWMEPLFSQNWRLFAPNPISENVEIDARASLDPDGRTTGWVNLSAQDQAAVRGNPVPGHLTENELRNAWFEWVDTHDGNGNPIGASAEVMQKYLLGVVLERLTGHVGGTIGSVQVRAITTLIPGPGRTAGQTAPQTRTLDWWPLPQSADSSDAVNGTGTNSGTGANNGSGGDSGSAVTNVGNG